MQKEIKTDLTTINILKEFIQENNPSEQIRNKLIHSKRTLKSTEKTAA